MSAPFHATETLDEAVTEHLELVAEVKKLGAVVKKQAQDILALRRAFSQVQTDVLRAVDVATEASGKCDVVLQTLKALRVDISRAMGTNGNGAHLG